MGSGPFNSSATRSASRSRASATRTTTTRGCPISTASSASIADKQAVRVDAIRADRAAIEFRGLPPSAIDQLKQELGDKIAVQTSDWNCGNLITPNAKRKPFDDVRVRRALTAGDRPAGTARRRCRRSPSCTPSAASSSPARRWPRPRRSCEKMAGFWPDIEKSRAEARRLLKEAGAEGLSFELLNRNVDQPYKYRRHLDHRRMEQDRRARHAEGGADRSVVRGDAQRQFRCGGRGQLPGRGQPAAGHAEIPAARRCSPRTTAATRTRRRSTSTTRCCTRPTPPSSGR